MKKSALIFALCCGLALSAGAATTTYTAFIGSNFFEYDVSALETGFGLIVPLEEGLSLEAQAAYAVSPDEGGVFMAIPVQLGVRFSFGKDPLALHLSLGLEPVFLFDPGFRIGPYLGVSGSLRVHEFLAFFVGLEQNLLFGGPNYVSTGTKVQGGLRFAFKPVGD